MSEKPTRQQRRAAARVTPPTPAVRGEVAKPQGQQVAIRPEEMQAELGRLHYTIMLLRSGLATQNGIIAKLNTELAQTKAKGEANGNQTV